LKRLVALAFAILGALGQPALRGLAHDEAQVPNWPSSRPPLPLSPRPVKFPPYEVRTLPNGMQVIVVMHREQPVVSARLLIRAGNAQDPPGKGGVAGLTTALLDQGTTKRNAQAIADAIDFIGGELHTGAGTDLSFAHVLVMKDSLSFGLELLSEIVRSPSFAPQELERQRQQILSGLTVGYQDPEYVANAVFERLVYGFNPYGLPGSGTPESIQKIAVDDLRAFHSRYFAPNNCILALVGDVSADEAFGTATRVFGDWAKRDIPPTRFIDPPDPTRRLVVVDKPDAVQTEIRVGHLGIARKNRDHLPMDLAIRILGGEGSNRLHRVLRTERGLTYGAAADMDSYKESGDFVAQTNTRTEATGEVLRLIIDEFWRLQRDPVGQRELADAQAYLSGSFPLTIETPDAIATQILNVLFYELPLDDLQNYRERVNDITVDDIQRVTRAFLRPDRLSIVLVGQASAFADQLQKIGFKKFEVVPLANLDLTAADFQRPLLLQR
jgi:zinc protease